MSSDGCLGSEPEPEPVGPSPVPPFAESAEREEDPDGIAVSVAWDRLRQVEQELATSSSREPADKRAARMAVDERVVHVLREDGFAGARFKEFSGRLLQYGFPILFKWITSGEIFAQCAHAGRPLSRHSATLDWTVEDRHRLSVDTAVDGFDFFRRYALERGGWDPNRGASLNTYYVGACIRCFPKVYNRWWREQLFEQNTLHATLDSWAEGEDPLHAVPDHRAVDPCHAAVVSDQVERAFGATSDRALKEGMVLRSTGFSQREAAEAVGLTEKALERRVGRWRQKLNREEGTR